MIKVSRFIAPIAATILAGALLAGPAFAAKGGGGGGGISSSGGGGSHGGGSGWSGGSGGFQGGHATSHSFGNGASMHSMHMSHQGSDRTRTRVDRGSNFAFSGPHDHHHHHHHRHFFGGGFIGGYENDWAYEPDCYLRRVHTRHHHWVLREVCY